MVKSKQAGRCLRLAAGLLTLVVLTGCVTPNPPLYRWGEYEDLIYAGYKNPGSSDPVTDANILAEDMARTEAEGKQVPPGVRVHLGYLYYSQGRDNEARALLEQEREVFPESQVFIDGLLARLGTQ